MYRMLVFAIEKTVAPALDVSKDVPLNTLKFTFGIQ